MVRDMTHGSPMRLIAGFWFPMLLGNLFQQVYNLADSVIVGRFVGVNAFAGVSATGSLNFMIVGFLLGMCSGCALPVALTPAKAFTPTKRPTITLSARL